jgi:hypothetical protein
MAQIIEVPNYGEVEFPDDMSDDDITAAIKKNAMGYKEPSAPKLTTGDKFLQGIKDPVDAGAQLLTNMLPKGVVSAGNKLNNFIADKTGLVARLPEGGVNQQISDNEAQYQAQRAAQGEDGVDWSRMGGNVLSPMNLAAASKLPAGLGIGKSMLAGAGLTALFQPVVGVKETGLSDLILGNEPKSFWEEKLKQAAIGGATGGILSGATSGISRLISPKASVNPNVQLLKAEGVTPTIGQTLGGGFNRAEEALSSVPVLGSMVSGARNRANTQFESAAHNRALKPIGLELPNGLSGRDAINFTESALKDKYDDVLGKIGAIQTDSAFNTKLSSLQSLVSKKVAPKAERAKFDSIVREVKDSIDQNGYLTSDAYKTLESSLGSKANKLGMSTNIYEGDLAPAVKQLQQELKDMLQRQSGQYADDLKAANTGWANFKRVQRASSALGAEDGSFTPAQLQNAVKALDKSKDKGAFARGKALNQDLTDAGKAVLGNKVRDSGTTERAFLGAAGIGGLAFEPTIAASTLAGSSLYTQPGQKLLNALVSSRPDLAVPFSEFIRKNGNYMLPASGAIGAGLLE